MIANISQEETYIPVTYYNSHQFLCKTIQSQTKDNIIPYLDHEKGTYLNSTYIRKTKQLINSHSPLDT